MSKPLKVEPAALHEMSNKLGTLAGDNTRTENYVKEWVSPSDNAGGLILSKVTSALEDLQSNLENNYRRLSEITASSSIQIGNAAYMYQTTDFTNAAALDKTYPGATK